ncbi:hypothetical protein [Mycobacterium sp.]|uniref:hypothetical protein n=1 Tax=Mycobacterium sp. TaxID=1785 RepID=UPI003C753BE9
MDEHPDFQSASAGRTAPPVRPLSSDQLPATKADLYAAVDALRADMRELLDQVRALIQDADRRVSDLEHARGQTSPQPLGNSFEDDDAEW